MKSRVPKILCKIDWPQSPDFADTVCWGEIGTERVRLAIQHESQNKGGKGCSSNQCCLNLLYLLCLWALSFHSHQFAGTRKRILRRENVSASFISPTVCCAHQPLSSSFSLSCCFMLHTTKAQFQNPLCEAFSKSPGKKEIPTAFIPLSMQFTSFMSWFPMLSPLQNYHSLEGTNHIFVPNTEKPPVMYFEWL